ncbi:hypothetical protein C4K12_1976 [Pseudomonas chlororaphis subsp. aureofaciens]|nr:hypothetical protein C4K15_1926 [Pseudomonas chlororaphis subsp. aurantiaca]AZD97852.1 hypothetical protein C4K12_1976 [Pseudomonas chlororaphis subsp. aureofaciens]AZE22392.1 hypothetical protein C4K08_1955 [Pseudomonas chlororaphis subsp. aureofaciens]
MQLRSPKTAMLDEVIPSIECGSTLEDEKKIWQARVIS